MKISEISKKPSVALLLASRMLELIEESGAAETEVYAAMGVVKNLLPLMGISRVPEAEMAK